MIIGIPKEILERERRVSSLPENVATYVKMGFDVLVESGAGEGAYRSDEEYRQAGGTIMEDVEELYSRADIILKVKQPYFNAKVGRHEADMVREGGTLITFIHPATPSNHEMVRKLRDRGITALTMDSIPRTSRAQSMDCLTAMSTVSGYKAVLLAACHLPVFVPIMGTAAGVLKPAKFLAVGVGVVGLQALAAAKRLGAELTAVDIREDARMGAQSLGAKVAGFDVPSEIALGEGGYANALSEEWLQKERDLLTPLLADMDVVVLSALVPGEAAPILVTEEMVASMKPGSVIMDISIDQGGNCALTRPAEEYHKGGVLISGLANIPGSVPVHSSWMYAHSLEAFVKNLFKHGVDKPDMADDIVQYSLVTQGGKVVHHGTLKAMGLV
ncbi:MAG: NAD(P) transhydrogenase subunit alpha [Gemmatimonadales bacterium]|nr:MAG: NAD(P) transhydrogenase subunit alpha [Gemmatimonadales bacterium]